MKQLFVIVPVIAILSACEPQQLVQKSSSMEPTIAANEHLIADLSAYSSSQPSRWDVIIFDPPEGGGIGPSEWLDSPVKHSIFQATH